MSSEVFAMLLDRRKTELSERALSRNLTRIERAELNALKNHSDKIPAVVHRIRILAAKMAQPNQLGLMFLKFTRQYKANQAELQALIQYGNSKAVWEIAYLQRKESFSKLNPEEEAELQYLQLYHDSPEVLRLTQLKVKESFGQQTLEDIRELTELHRNLYRDERIPDHLLELFWPSGENPQKVI
jgi:hypothetical protein